MLKLAALNYYFTNSIKKIPNKDFIGLPNSTFRLLIYTVRLLKENRESEVRIFDGQGFRIIMRPILYQGNLLVCCTDVAYGQAVFSLCL